MPGPTDPPSRQADIAGPADLLAAETTAWSDEWFDPDRGLLWNPPGAFPGTGARRVHLVPQSAWYALGLLRRGAPGDRERATLVLDALVALQYDAPGTPWDGTYARFGETPVPGPGAVVWDDYDPNWRQFLGTTFLVVLDDHAAALPAATRAAVEGSLDRAVRREPPERVPTWYTNIALKRAFLEVEWGRRTGDTSLRTRGEHFTAALVERFDRHGAFDEYNSPTYAGVDLWALALWRDRCGWEAMRGWGERLEAALWRDLARHYHAGLRNLAGPWTRAYGVDLRRYVGKVGLWIAAAIGRDAAPLPPLDAPADHEHDWCFGPGIAAVGVRVPDDALSDLLAFRGERTVEQVVDADLGRVATSWLGDRVLVGAETAAIDFGGWEQYHPAVVHWELPAGSAPGVGTLVLRHAGRVEAVAARGRLTATCHPPTNGRAEPVLEIDPAPDPGAIAGTTWHLPGLTVSVRTNATVAPCALGDGALRVPLVATTRAEPVHVELELHT